MQIIPLISKVGESSPTLRHLVQTAAEFNSSQTFSDEEFGDIRRGLGTDTAVQVERVYHDWEIVRTSGIQYDAHQRRYGLYSSVLCWRFQSI